MSEINLSPSVDVFHVVDISFRIFSHLCHVCQVIYQMSQIKLLACLYIIQDYAAFSEFISIKLSQFGIRCFTVQNVKLSRKRGYMPSMRQSSDTPLWFFHFLNIIQCFITDTENSHFHIMWLTASTSIIPLSLGPTGYTGAGDCKGWRWHAWEKPPYSLKKNIITSPLSHTLSTGSYFLPTFFHPLSQQPSHLCLALCQNHWAQACNSIRFPSMHNPLLLRRHSGAPSQECYKEKRL